MNNYTGSPEQLKIIAEAMGYNITESSFGGRAVNRLEGSGVWDYNPSTNAEQLLEAEDYLFDGEGAFFLTKLNGKFQVASWSFSKIVIDCKGKTRAEAVLSAIWGTIEVVE